MRRGLWRPSRSSLGAHEHGGPFAAHGATHVPVAIHGRRPRGTERRDDDLVLATAAAASVRRTIEPAQSGIRRRRGPAFVLRPRCLAFALLGFFGLVAVAAAHAGVDVARARARTEIGIVFVRVPAAALVFSRAVLADDAALRRRRPGSARQVGAHDRDCRKRRKPKTRHEPHVTLSPCCAMTRKYGTEAQRIVNLGEAVASTVGTGGGTTGR